MASGDMDFFVSIVEEEALMLHALMMTSDPSYILLKPDSLLVIEKIKEFRSQSRTPLCFTIDAGPNIHVLYPQDSEEVVKDWMKRELGQWNILHDKVGMGPTLLKE